MGGEAEGVEGAVRDKIVIGGETIELWFEQGDNYLGSREALTVRSAEASAFRNTCVQLIRNLSPDSTTCLDVGANVGLTSLVLGRLACNRETSTPISQVYAFEPEHLTFWSCPGLVDGLPLSESYQ